MKRSRTPAQPLKSSDVPGAVPKKSKAKLNRTLLAAVTAAAVLGAGGYLLTSGNADESKVSGNAAAGKQRMFFLVDGWSYLTLKDQHPKWRLPQDTSSTTSDSMGLNVETSASGKWQPLSFTPVDAAGFTEIATKTPEMLARLTGRLVSTSQDVSCSAGGCSTAAGVIPLTDYTKPSSIPGLGDSYAAYGMGSSLYVAAVDVPTAASTIDLSADGYKTYEVPTGVPTDAIADKTPSAENGYASRHWLMSAAWGRYFIPTATWQKAKGVRYYTPVMSATTAGKPAAGKAEMLRGQGVASPLAATMTADELTYYSSPTTGCGVALCVPGKAKVEVVKNSRRNVEMCSASDTPAKVHGLVADTTMNVTFPYPTSQFGAWAGKAPSSFPNAYPGKELMPGQAPLTSGTQKLRFAQVFYTGGDDNSVFSLTGSVYQAPFDSPKAFATEVTNKDLAKTFTFVGTKYAPC